MSGSDNAGAKIVDSFDWALIRVVPRVERGECVNVGAIVACATKRFLAAKLALDPARVKALDASIDLDELELALASIPLIAAGDPAGGPIAALPRGERFHWLVAPRSAVIQTSPVHTGLCDDPQAALEDLIARLVST
ncbi:MAG TPA: DUF3037 domain-containing protein [Kofleriaceae bacterium]